MQDIHAFARNAVTKNSQLRETVVITRNEIAFTRNNVAIESNICICEIQLCDRVTITKYKVTATR